MGIYNFFNTKVLFCATSILLVFFVVAIGFYGFIHYQITTPLITTKERSQPHVINFVIEKGEEVKEIAQKLEKLHLIRGAFYFEVYVWRENIGTELQAGQYRIYPEISIKEIAKKFVRGDVISNEEEITFPEGFSLADMEKRLYDNGFNSIYLTQFKPFFFGSRFVFLRNITAVNLEGFLFPDTYKFDKDWDAEKIAGKMLENFDKKISNELLWEIKKQNRTIFEIIIMASVIEKEVATENDKKLVSGILWKRLGVGMPLQADATITYIMGKKTSEITLDDLKINSPYNTYVNKGLPIAPISNPGMESILAAIYPEPSDYWYYLSKPSGESVFSQTLDEHNRAKAKYLK